MPPRIASRARIESSQEAPRPRFTLLCSHKAAATIAALLFFFAMQVQARRLPTRIYSTADGLPNDTITCTYRDSHDFLWFCTTEGLSRFDGYTFTNYSVAQGLPDRVVADLLETRNGQYWVGTARGVALLNPKPDKGPMFSVYGASETGGVTALQEDTHGIVWIAADSGLFQLVPSQGTWTVQRSGLKIPQNYKPELFLSDHAGNLWITVHDPNKRAALWRRKPDGTSDVFDDPFLIANRVSSITQDHLGRIWVSTFHGLALMAPNPQLGRPLFARVFDNWHQPTREVGSVFESSDGRIWLWAYGTWEIVTDPGGHIQFRMFDPNGHGYDLEDREGNLWSGREKTARSAFITYGPEDGLKTNDVRSIFEGNDGSLYVVTGIHSRFIHRFDGEHFTDVAPRVPGHDAGWDWGGWGWGQTHLQDHLGEWWMATWVGLYRYPAVSRLEDLAQTLPKVVYQKPRNIFRLYEDSRGDIWVSAWDGCLRWERTSQRFIPFPPGFGLPISYREDRAGNLWMGSWEGGLFRYRHGQYEWVVRPKTFPTGSMYSLFLDHQGRLWASTTRSGLVRIDDPGADHPKLSTYSTKDGLSSDDVRAVTEDHFGEIYFWTDRGVDRLNPTTGAIHHYTEADGLVSPGSDHHVAYCDREGRLWFGLDGLSLLQPAPVRHGEPPPIRITQVKIQDQSYLISELGEIRVDGLVLPHNKNQIEIGYSSVNFGPGDAIRYQYKLEGVAGSDWSPATEIRAVNYPNVPPGRYRFLVRAVNAEGVVSPTVATVDWQILPPVWRRWWFLTLAALLTAWLIYRAYNYRVHHLLDLERIRTRIATDLHDDIGSSLTQIAIMSEVVRQRRHDDADSEPLVRIADLSRELVDSMSDIVWAVNPKRDHLGDLAQRMRRLASDMLDGANIDVQFRAPAGSAATSLSAELRREIFLIFKEAINNVVRHANSSVVEITFDVRGDELFLEVHDNGLGFQPLTIEGQGHGINSMEERARRVGGSVVIESDPGRGTTIRLNARLGRSTTLRQLIFPRS